MPWAPPEKSSFGHWKDPRSFPDNPTTQKTKKLLKKKPSPFRTQPKQGMQTTVYEMLSTFHEDACLVAHCDVHAMPTAIASHPEPLTSVDVRFFDAPVRARAVFDDVQEAQVVPRVDLEIRAKRREWVDTINTKKRSRLLCASDMEHAVRDVITLCITAGIDPPITSSWGALRSSIMIGHERDQAVKCLSFLDTELESRLPQAQRA